MALKNNKKGMFFTLFVIIVLSLLVLTVTFLSFVEERKIVKDRITTLNSFVFSVEEDIPRKVYTTAFRIIFLLEKPSSNSYISLNTWKPPSLSIMRVSTASARIVFIIISA